MVFSFVTPSLEGSPPKAEEPTFPQKIRMSQLDDTPVFPSQNYITLEETPVNLLEILTKVWEKNI